jgi:hypothetical protein
MNHKHNVKPASAANKDQRHLGVMVCQRLADGHGPGPIRIFKTVMVEQTVGTTTRVVPLKVPLDHQLPAGTAELTSVDKKVFAAQGLSSPQIVYVERKLLDKRAASDAHRAAFEDDKSRRLKERVTARLITQLAADQRLAADVMSALRKAGVNSGACEAPAQVQRALTLSEKVSKLLSLTDEVCRDMEAYKDRAKVGKTYDKSKLRLMLSRDAERDWKLCWFAFSRMIDQATGTFFARPRGWGSDKELLKLAVAHGYKAASEAL